MPPRRYAIKDRGSFYAKKAAARKTIRGASARRSYVSRPMGATTPAAGELHGVDHDLTNTDIVNTVDTNGSADVINAIQQGAGSWNRLGRKIKMKSVRLKGCLRYQHKAPNGGTGIGYFGAVRMVLVYCKERQIAGTPNFDDIFGYQTQSTSADGSTGRGCTVLSPPRLDKIERYQVLAERVFEAPLINQGPDSTDVYQECWSNIPFDIYVDLKGRETSYTSSNSPSTIADINGGALIVYWRKIGVEADSGAGTTPLDSWDVTSDSFARLRFTP